MSVGLWSITTSVGSRRQMTEVPLGVPTTCDGAGPHPCDKHHCDTCLTHIYECSVCWAESEDDLRADARITYLTLMEGT